MPQKSKRKLIIDVLQTAGLILACAALIVYPKQSVDAAKSGVELCWNVIVPSLFPFFVLSALIISTGVADLLGRFCEKIMRPLFNVSGASSAAFVLGFIGGYPVGAKTVITLYNGRKCTKQEAERLLSFCNNSGPAFIFGVVGAGIFSSGQIGLLLYLVHTVSSLLIGVCFRFWGRGREDYREYRVREKALTGRQRFIPAFIDAIKTSFSQTLSICGFVIFFTVLIKMLVVTGAIPKIADVIGTIFGPLGLSADWSEKLLTGIIEISSGVWTLKDATASISSSVAMAAFMLGWAGLSVHMQVLSFIGESGLSVRTYIIGKVSQGVLSAAFIWILTRVIVLDAPVAGYLAVQVKTLSELSFLRAAQISGLVAAGIFVAVYAGCFALARRK
ncbi:MAG: sporulation protein [Oscillospiraceae bacterium]|jgi:sporulation integral membrane protein YlbJ|nr:sporulation protein [Oscillospiraceae bacterium]